MAGFSAPTQRRALSIPGQRNVAAQEGLEPQSARLSSGENVVLQRRIERREPQQPALSRREDLELHPTVKPVAMVADAICDVTRQGELFLDIFLGPGTA